MVKNPVGRPPGSQTTKEVGRQNAYELMISTCFKMIKVDGIEYAQCLTPSCQEQAELTSKRNRVIGRINVSSRGHTANLRTHLKTKGNDCAEHKILWEKYETRFNEELGKGTNLCPLEKKKYKDSKSLTLTRADCIANVIQLCVVNNLPYSFFQQNYNRYDV